MIHNSVVYYIILEILSMCLPMADSHFVDSQPDFLYVPADQVLASELKPPSTPNTANERRQRSCSYGGASTASRTAAIDTSPIPSCMQADAERMWCCLAVLACPEIPKTIQGWHMLPNSRYQRRHQWSASTLSSKALRAGDP